MNTIGFLNINNRKIAYYFKNAYSKRIVIICHGFQGSQTGCHRKFIELANRLAENNVCSIRFDQYGCGNSDGDFFESSFNDWVTTIITISQLFKKNGYEISLFGQSMGGSAAIITAKELDFIQSVVAWVPDPVINKPAIHVRGYEEEYGERIRDSYWQEAYDANIIEAIKYTNSSTLIFSATSDKLVSMKAINAMRKALNDNYQKMIILRKYSHSNWTFNKYDDVISKTVDFIIANSTT